MDKNVGVITFYSIPNYGSFLQAYALVNTINNLDPSFNCKLIDYVGNKHFNWYYGFFDFSKKYWIINPHFYKDSYNRFFIRKKEIVESRKFIKFYDEIPHTSRLKRNELNKKSFSSVVLGSDLIWDFSFPFLKKEKTLFGLGLNCKNVFSYGASFGSTQKDIELPNYVKKGLSSLSAISVRDVNSKEIITSALPSKEAQLVVDPTFLWDFNNDKNIIEPKEKNFAIVYGSFFTESQIKNFCSYCKNNSYTIICIDSGGDRFTWVDRIIPLGKITPFEWLGFFQKAKVVLTCTFHGLVFGLIFHKKLFFNQTKFIYNKISFFADAIGIKSYLANCQGLSYQLNHSLDYDSIDKKLIDLKSSSLTFLLSNLR